MNYKTQLFGVAITIITAYLVSDFVLSNMSYKSWKLANSSLNLNGKTALIIGGTQGIGSGVAVRFAQIGASVAIAGRNEQLANELISQLKSEAKNPQQEFKFFKIDATSVRETDRFAEEAKIYFEQKGGLDYLIQSQGAINSGTVHNTSEGMERNFVLQAYSKWHITYKLLPVIRESVVYIFHPASKGKIDFDDVQLQKGRSVLAAGDRDSVFIDASVKEFQKRNSNLRFYHLSPGIVKTNLLRNSGFGAFLSAAADIFGGIAGRDPVTYADHPVFVATSNQVPNGSRIDEKAQEYSSYEWIENESNREKLFEWNINTLNRLTK